MAINIVGNNIELVNTVSPSALVPNTRQMITPMTVVGGGDLTADRTLTLENDMLSPGILKYYGTNQIGIKGWHNAATELAPILPDTYISSEVLSSPAINSGTNYSSEVFNLTIPPTAKKALINFTVYTTGQWTAYGGMLEIRSVGATSMSARFPQNFSNALNGYNVFASWTTAQITTNSFPLGSAGFEATVHYYT
jgi:hypothetical protein